MDRTKTKWWGWGTVGKEYDLRRRPFFWAHLRQRLDVVKKPVFLAPQLEDIDLPSCRLTDSDFQLLRKILAHDHITSSKDERVAHTYGKSYHDLLRIRYKIFPEAPDAVLYPESESEIREILAWASEHQVGVIPWGGGTSVVGGVEASRARGQRGLVVLDLKNLCKVVEIHKKSMLADVQAGIFGPELEEALQSHGFTLAHYPESFEFSTLGGWIAARSAGQQSTLYGKIEDMVESLRLVTPAMVLETPHLPAAAIGPDLDQMVIGSEGIFGVITQARLRIKPLPERKFYTTVLFRTFMDGAEALRQVIQSGLKPATLRLSDAPETDFVFSLMECKDSFFAKTTKTMGLRWLGKKGFRPGERSFLILGLEGTSEEVDFQWQAIQRIFAPFSVFYLKEKTGQSWYRHRFENPYLRDTMMDYGLLIDTLETVTEWDNMGNLYASVTGAIKKEYATLGIKGVVLAHLSHLYPAGSSLYFILLATPNPENELVEWQALKKAASDAIVRAGGAISHHHGIGLDHKPWMHHGIGSSGIELLRRIKQEIDPKNILNPNKLLPDDDAME
jgi:alkyldihydroxyacetonephosphate synthase